MKHRKRGRDGEPPSFVDPEFMGALEAEGGPSGTGRRHGEHKARQLCRQVERALNLALAGASGDEALDGLFVAEVTPAPDSGHLLVRVIVPAGRPVADVLAALHRAAPGLRAEVAMAITRKRAPELSFYPGACGGDHE